MQYLDHGRQSLTKCQSHLRAGDMQLVAPGRRVLWRNPATAVAASLPASCTSAAIAIAVQLLRHCSASTIAERLMVVILRRCWAAVRLPHRRLGVGEGVQAACSAVFIPKVPLDVTKRCAASLAAWWDA